MWTYRSNRGVYDSKVFLEFVAFSGNEQATHKSLDQIEQIDA